MGKKNASPVERISLCRSRSHANSCPFPCHLRIFTAFPCSRRKGSRRDWKEDSPVRESRKVRMLSVTFPPQKRATGKDTPARLKKAPSLAVVFQIRVTLIPEKGSSAGERASCPFSRRCHGKEAPMTFISFPFRAAFHKRFRRFTRQTGTYRMGCCIRPEIDYTPVRTCPPAFLNTSRWIICAPCYPGAWRKPPSRRKPEWF